MDKLFKEAYQIALNTSTKLPPDIMLKLYALYKQATKDTTTIMKGSDNLVHAFKMNARIQAKHLSKEEAQREYIDIVNKYLK